jgi:hypothetical protein
VSRNFDGVLAFSASGTNIYDEIEPVDEPENHYCDASRKCLSFLFCVLDFLASYRKPKELEIKLWSVLSALQHPAIEIPSISPNSVTFRSGDTNVRLQATAQGVCATHA